MAAPQSTADKTKSFRRDYKVFNDPIHGLVELHPLLVKIIDTPQFQRLRNIKQLGGTSYVYPGATHSRFEHSIGVAYLAGELVQALMENQPELKITLAEKLCVQIAGLCHDLGHGPFSHLYDRKIVPEIRDKLKKENKLEDETEWKHETASVKMFDHLVDDKLKGGMRKAGLKLPKDLEFIKKLIDPEYELAEGHTQDKSFLYEIVANKRNEIDVDKWDYFARDCHYLGIKNSFDYRRLILCARVCRVEGRTEICFRDKEVFNLYDMFYTRFCLHKRAYQHKVTNAVECMITDAFVKSYKHIQVRGSEGMLNLYKAKDDMEAYTKLTDCVFQQILNQPDVSEDSDPDVSGNQPDVSKDSNPDVSGNQPDVSEDSNPDVSGNQPDVSEDSDPDDSDPDDSDPDDSENSKPDDPGNPNAGLQEKPNPEDVDNLKQAKRILARIHRRKLYKCLAEFHTTNLEITKEAVRGVWEQELKTALAEIPQKWKKEDFLVDIIKLDYGMGKEDPIQHVHFYRKKEQNDPIQFTRKEPQNEEIQKPQIKRISLTREVSHLLPETFAEKTIRIYYKGTKAKILKAAKDYFEGVDFKKKFQQFLKQTEEEAKRKD